MNKRIKYGWDLILRHFWQNGGEISNAIGVEELKQSERSIYTNSLTYSVGTEVLQCEGGTWTTPKALSDKDSKAPVSSLSGLVRRSGVMCVQDTRRDKDQYLTTNPSLKLGHTFCPFYSDFRLTSFSSGLLYLKSTRLKLHHGLTRHPNLKLPVLLPSIKVYELLPTGEVS